MIEHVSYPCDGCGEPGSEQNLWLQGELGLSCMHVHERRECAERAREARGGGRFVRLGPAKGVRPGTRLAEALGG